jgi:tRNA nucleotidyltransferase (CCA-adding enzyme)
MDIAAAVQTPAAHWKHFDHGADIGVRGLGPTKAAAFEQVALALTAVITDPDRIEPLERVLISCEAGDDEQLLAAWLNAVVTQMAVRRMLFKRYEVELQGGRLTGMAIGERISPEWHQPAVGVKGATYASLRDGGWVAQTVVDV